MSSHVIQAKHELGSLGICVPGPVLRASALPLCCFTRFSGDIIVCNAYFDYYIIMMYVFPDKDGKGTYNLAQVKLVCQLSF